MVLITPITSTMMLTALSRAGLQSATLAESVYAGHPAADLDVFATGQYHENFGQLVRHGLSAAPLLTPHALSPSLTELLDTQSANGPFHYSDVPQLPPDEYQSVRDGLDLLAAGVRMMARSEGTSGSFAAPEHLLALGIGLRELHNGLQRAETLTGHLLTSEGKSPLLAGQRLRDMLYARLRTHRDRQLLEHRGKIDEAEKIRLKDIHSVALDCPFTTLNKIDTELTTDIGTLIFRAAREFFRHDQGVDEFLRRVEVEDLLRLEEDHPGQTTITNRTVITLQLSSQERLQEFIRKIRRVIETIIHKILSYREENKIDVYWDGLQLVPVPRRPLLVNFRRTDDEIFYILRNDKGEEIGEIPLSEVPFEQIHVGVATYDGSEERWRDEHPVDPAQRDIAHFDVRTISRTFRNPSNVLKVVLRLPDEAIRRAESAAKRRRVVDKFARREGSLLRSTEIVGTLKKIADNTNFHLGHDHLRSDTITREGIEYAAVSFAQLRKLAERLAEQFLAEGRSTVVPLREPRTSGRRAKELAYQWLLPFQTRARERISPDDLLENPAVQEFADVLFGAFLGRVVPEPSTETVETDAILYALFEASGGFVQPGRLMRAVWDDRAFGLMDNVNRAVLLLGRMYYAANAGIDYGQMFSDFRALLGKISPQLTSAIELMRVAGYDLQDRVTRPNLEMAALGAIHTIEEKYYPDLERQGVVLQGPPAGLMAIGFEGSQFGLVDETTDRHVIDAQFKLLRRIFHRTVARLWGLEGRNEDERLEKAKEIVEVYFQGDEGVAFLPRHDREGGEVDPAEFAKILREELRKMFPKKVHFQYKVHDNGGNGRNGSGNGLVLRPRQYRVTFDKDLPDGVAAAGRAVWVAAGADFKEKIDSQGFPDDDRLWILGVGDQKLKTPVQLSFSELIASETQVATVEKIEGLVDCRLCVNFVPFVDPRVGDEEALHEKKWRLVRVLSYLFRLDSKVQRQERPTAGIYQEGPENGPVMTQLDLEV